MPPGRSLCVEQAVVAGSRMRRPNSIDVVQTGLVTPKGLLHSRAANGLNRSLGQCLSCLAMRTICPCGHTGA